MGFAQALLRNRGFLFFSILLIICVAVAPPCSAQNTKAKQQQEPWAQELNKYPGLSEEFGRLFVKIQQTVQFPAPRKESRLLPLVPKSSLFYAAIPNYGEVAAQVLKVFRAELQESKPLGDWWTHGQWAAEGPKVEDALDKFAQLHQYLGDEIVISVTMEGKEPAFLVASETHQPGLKKFLQQATEQMSGKSKPGIRILDSQELAEAKAKTPSEELLLLVRPDFIAAATDIAALRSFNARVNAGNREFAATPFGQRVLKEYRGGTTVMAAADMQKILEKSSPALKESEPFRQSGFSEMQYLVWDHATLAGKQISQMELSFSSPRHGAAGWLAKPRTLGSLDFVSPKAIMASTFVLSDPAQILEDVKAIAGPSNTAAFAAIPALEQGLNLSVKDDLLGLLGGEITMELDSFTPSQPAWRLILSVKDSNHLQQTLNAITAATHFESSQEDDGGVTYYSLRVPSGKTTTQIVYAQMNGYMVMGPTHDAVADSLRLQRSGESLAKSKRFVDSLPPGNSSGASALFYEDPFGLVTTQLKSQRPDLVESLAPYTNAAPPIVMSFYGEESAIREVSANQAFDATGALIVAAIAIPNLLRSKIAANEASAVGSVRTINTAQVTYGTVYPKKGFASDLAALGPDPSGPNAYSPEHAGLLDEHLGSPNCVGDAWCTKSGYNFKVATICKLKVCKEYVVVATPVSESTGTRSFCSTSDGIIRYKVGSSVSSPVTVSECRAWLPLH